MGLNRNQQVLVTISLSSLIFLLSAEAARNGPSSIISQPVAKNDSLQACLKLVKQDIQLIEKKFWWLLNAERDPKSCVPEACLQKCSKSYVSILDDLNKACDDLQARDFFFVNEDFTSLSDDMSNCEECIDDKVNGDCPLNDLNEKLKQHSQKCLGAFDVTGFEF